MNASKTTTVALALAAALGASTTAQAGTNPFGLSAMDGGYMQLAEAATGDSAGDAKKTVAEGKCGEGKCGANKKAGTKTAAEGKCGGDKKAAEGKCGGDKKAAEGKCGGSK